MAGGEERLAVPLTQVVMEIFFTGHLILGFWKLLGRGLMPPGCLWLGLRNAHYTGGPVERGEAGSQNLPELTWRTECSCPPGDITLGLPTTSMTCPELL